MVPVHNESSRALNDSQMPSEPPTKECIKFRLFHCKNCWIVLNSLETYHPTFGIYSWLVCQSRLHQEGLPSALLHGLEGAMRSSNCVQRGRASLGFLHPAYPEGAGPGSHRTFIMDQLRRERPCRQLRTKVAPPYLQVLCKADNGHWNHGWAVHNGLLLTTKKI